MTIIRHAATTPTNIPAAVTDHTTDYCPCGATYSTRDGDPDQVVYGAWLDVHIAHLDPKDGR